MPKYRVEDSSGRALIMEGDEPPDEETIDEAFKQFSFKPKKREMGWMERGARRVAGNVAGIATFPLSNDLTDPLLKPLEETIAGAPTNTLEQRIKSRAGDLMAPLRDTPPASLDRAKAMVGILANTLGHKASSIVMPQVEQAQQALSAPSPSEALGHGAAAALPMLGPMAAGAGEELGKDPTSPEGWADVATLLVPEALRGRAALRERAKGVAFEQAIREALSQEPPPPRLAPTTVKLSPKAKAAGETLTPPPPSPTMEEAFASVKKGVKASPIDKLAPPPAEVAPTQAPPLQEAPLRKPDKGQAMVAWAEKKALSEGVPKGQEANFRTKKELTAFKKGIAEAEKDPPTSLADVQARLEDSGMAKNGARAKRVAKAIWDSTQAKKVTPEEVGSTYEIDPSIHPSIGVRLAPIVAEASKTEAHSNAMGAYGAAVEVAKKAVGKLLPIDTSSIRVGPAQFSLSPTEGGFKNIAGQFTPSTSTVNPNPLGMVMSIARETAKKGGSLGDAAQAFKNKLLSNAFHEVVHKYVEGHQEGLVEGGQVLDQATRFQMVNDFVRSASEEKFGANAARPNEPFEAMFKELYPHAKAAQEALLSAGRTGGTLTESPSGVQGTAGVGAGNRASLEGLGSTLQEPPPTTPHSGEAGFIALGAPNPMAPVKGVRTSFSEGVSKQSKDFSPVEWWRRAQLGPHVPAMKAISDTLMAATDIVTKAISPHVERAMLPKGAIPELGKGRAFAAINGYMAASGEALRVAAKEARKGKWVDPTKWIPNVINDLAASVGHGASLAELATIAHDVASKHGLKVGDPKYTSFVKDYIELQGKFNDAYYNGVAQGKAGQSLVAPLKKAFGNDYDRLAQARNRMEVSGQEKTFTDPPGIITRSVHSLHNVPFIGPIAKILIPFPHIPYNLFIKRPIEYSPLGLRELGKTVGSGARAEVVSKAIVGTAIFNTLGFAILKGVLKMRSGEDPDWEKEALKRKVSGMPYQLQIGKNAYRVDHLGPIGRDLTLAADMKDLWDRWQDAKDGDTKKDIERKMQDLQTRMMGSIVHNLTPPYVESMEKFFEAIESPRHMEMLGTALESSLVPSIVRTGAQSLDPNLRQSSGTLGPIKRNLPGLSLTQPPVVDWSGEEVKRDEGAFEHFFSPLDRHKLHPEAEVENELIRLGARPPTTTGTITFGKASEKLSPEEYNALKKEVGPKERKAIEKVMARPEYHSASDTRKRAILTKLYEQLRSGVNSRALKMKISPSALSSLKKQLGSYAEKLNAPPTKED